MNATSAAVPEQVAGARRATIDYLSQSFPNPFSGTNPIYGANISRAGLLVPYPQFGSVRCTNR